MNIKWAGESNRGYVRENNEDFFLTDVDMGVWIISDGMGGHSIGEVASKTAVGTVYKCLKDGISLYDSVLFAHEEVKKLAENRVFSRPPGATICVLKIEDKTWECVWAGDSSLWMWDGRKLKKLTQDHTRPWDLVRWGSISEEEALNHPAKNVLTRCLGMKGEFVPERIEGRFDPDKCAFVLTTDGAIGHESPKAMEKCLKDAKDPEYAVKKIIAASLHAGGRDNVTVLVVGWCERKGILKRILGF